MISVTPDTNILISGLNFPGGKPFAFLELAREGKIRLAVSDAILDEMADVLARKFDFTSERIERARSFITRVARVVMPAVRWMWSRTTRTTTRSSNALRRRDPISS